MKIKGCIFDLDGTLLNTLTTIRYYVNEALFREGAEGITVEQCREMVGKGARNLLERALAAKNHKVEDFEAFYKGYDAHYNSAPDYLTEPYEGIPEMIQGIFDKGLRIAVLFNKPEGAVRPLVERFFGDKVEIVMGGSAGVPLKPDPLAVAPILDFLGLRADETAFIGDSEVDMITAKNYGAALAIGVTWGYRDRDALVKNGADVLADKAEDVLSFLLDGVRF